MSLFGRAEQIVRYYGVGAVNTAFGYGLYAALVALGLNLYVAQFAAHLTGACFNYFTFRAHVFREGAANPLRYAAAYAGNYLISLGFLALFTRVTGSPYLAGLLSILGASFVNFFVLKFLVFRPRAATA